MARTSTRASPSTRLKRRVDDVVDGFVEHDLLTSASAIAFRLLFAIVPLLLFALSLASYLELGDLWRAALAPRIGPLVTPATFAFLNETVEGILATRQALWLTVGAVIALWEISGAVRAVMGALNRIYRAERVRSFWQRMLTSLVLAIGVGACLLAGVLVLQFGPLEPVGLAGGPALEAVDYVLRLALAAGLLLIGVGLLVGYAPTDPQSLRWVSFGSALTVTVWFVISYAFGWYMTSLAPYATVFGGLASLIVLMTYLYVSSIAFVLGAQLDQIVREEVGEADAPEG